jgi:hypothetical protein
MQVFGKQNQLRVECPNLQPDHDGSIDARRTFQKRNSNCCYIICAYNSGYVGLTTARFAGLQGGEQTYSHQ